MVTVTVPRRRARSCASPSSLASLRRWAWRSCSTILRLESVAATPSLRGSRKLRAYPAATFTTSPRAPRFSTSSLRMISIAMSDVSLNRCCKRQQGDVAGFQNGVGKAALVRRADAGNAARNDFAALGDEGLKRTHVLIVDVVHLFHAEAADLLATEILFLTHGGGFVPAGGALVGSDRSSTFLFSHV